MMQYVPNLSSSLTSRASLVRLFPQGPEKTFLLRISLPDSREMISMLTLSHYPTLRLIGWLIRLIHLHPLICIEPDWWFPSFKFFYSRTEYVWYFTTSSKYSSDILFLIQPSLSHIMSGNVVPSFEPKYVIHFKEAHHVKLTNLTPKKIYFELKTTALLNYCVRPASGTVDPESTSQIAIIFQKFDEGSVNDNHKFWFKPFPNPRVTSILKVWWVTPYFHWISLSLSLSPIFPFARFDNFLCLSTVGNLCRPNKEDQIAM